MPDYSAKLAGGDNDKEMTMKTQHSLGQQPHRGPQGTRAYVETRNPQTTSLVIQDPALPCALRDTGRLQPEAQFSSPAFCQASGEHA